MAAGADPIVLYSVVAVLLAEVVALIFWFIALIRVRRSFLTILVASSICVLFFTTVNGLMVYDPRIAVRIFETRERFRVFYHWFVWVQAANVFLFLIGQIFLVRWMIKAKQSSGPKPAAVVDRLI